MRANWGLRQPIFVGTASVDNALIANDGYAAEGVIGAWPLPLSPDSDEPDMVKFREAWLKLNPIRPRVVQISLNVYAYDDTCELAEALRRAGRDLAREKLVGTPKNMRDYRIGGVATPRTFTRRHHIGNNLLRCLSSRPSTGFRWLGGRRGRVNSRPSFSSSR